MNDKAYLFFLCCSNAATLKCPDLISEKAKCQTEDDLEATVLVNFISFPSLSLAELYRCCLRQQMSQDFDDSLTTLFFLFVFVWVSRLEMQIGKGVKGVKAFLQVLNKLLLIIFIHQAAPQEGQRGGHPVGL